MGKKFYVFVYGTLRKGYWNHRLLENSKFLGEARTKEKYSLYADGIPYVVKIPRTHIKGEVYEVDEETLRRLDQLEEHPDVYYREEIEVLLNGKPIKAWIYFYPYPEGEFIPSGDYKDYGKI